MFVFRVHKYFVALNHKKRQQKNAWLCLIVKVGAFPKAQCKTTQRQDKQL